MFSDNHLIGEKVKLLSHDFNLIKSLYLSTQKNFDTGLFDEELELFPFYIDGMSLDDCIVELFQIIQLELQKKHRDNKPTDELKFSNQGKSAIYCLAAITYHHLCLLITKSLGLILSRD